MDDSKVALGLGGMSTTVTNIINDIYKLAGVVENTLLPKIQAASRAMGGMSAGMNGGGGGNGGDTRTGSSPGNFVNKIAQSPATPIVSGIAAAAMNAMPGVPTAVVQDLLTQRSSFYGQGGLNGAGGVRSLQKSLAHNGTALNNMDSTNALIAAQASGLSGVSNFNQVMQGAAQASNFTPGIGLTAATQAIGNTLNSANTVNLARTIGINIRQPDGSMLTLPQMVDQIWNYLKKTSPGVLDKKDMQFSLQPGYGIYNMLNGLFNGDPMMIKMVGDELLAKATFGGAPLSSITKAQMVSAGIQSATIRNMASQTAAATNVLTSTSSAIAGGYAGAADIGTGMNNLAASMSDLTAALGGGKGFLSGTLGLGGGAVGSALKGFGIFSIIKSILPLLGGFLAEGGPADQNVPYIVGEKGPELFVPKTDGTVIPNHIIGRQNGGDMSAGGFAMKLLQGLGAKATPQAIADLVFWEGKEGGNWQNTAKYNPLNTSYQMKGSTNYNTGQAGSGVQAYTSWDQGVQATIGTLTGQDAGARGYTNIVDILKKGGTSTANFFKAMQKSSWDGGHYGDSTMTPSTSSTSINQVATDPTAAARFAQAQAQAFGTSASAFTSPVNYNYGGINIVINSPDPKTAGASVVAELKKTQMLHQAGKK